MPPTHRRTVSSIATSIRTTNTSELERLRSHIRSTELSLQALWEKHELFDAITAIILEDSEGTARTVAQEQSEGTVKAQVDLRAHHDELRSYLTRVQQLLERQIIDFAS